MHTTKDVINTIKGALPDDRNLWTVLGFINPRKQILAFGNDSKIIGRLFEVVVEPYLRKAADELGYELGLSEQQTVYPDFWFSKPNGRMIAIDIKSTYRRFSRKKHVSNISFTLGGYASFLRNGTKNIYGTYDRYDAHIVIGFVYTRNTEATVGITDIADIDRIKAAYADVSIFVQEKYKIAGQSKGSGNTNNIGTIKASSIEPFVEGRSYFSVFGNSVFEDYWRNYQKYTDSRETKNALYTDLPGYFDWLDKNGKKDQSEVLRTKYEEWLADPRNEGIV
ncbi:MULTISPECIES: type II restriction endonuclease [Lacticaseibacillus]|uniref:type II restriction endonuclease n=1 Tax=Lacticaseibacillus TaxID=2759736 RepID=UPI00063D8A96|nr:MULTISPECIES: type II restriction endonuclease [Lacticaseibacillus]KLI76884.1 restriction endonuclease [Lacticaseibacillus casei]